MYNGEDEFTDPGRTIEDYLKIQEPGRETKKDETVQSHRLLRKAQMAYRAQLPRKS